MAERYRPKELKLAAETVYFGSKPKLDFIKSGCTLLDCVVSGGYGWPLGRIVNVVGDKAVGKTLLAIEACANFAVQYPKGRIWYREAEAAFDLNYAKALGLPAERVDFGPEGPGFSWDTAEDIFEDLQNCISQSEKLTLALAKKLREKNKKLDEKEAYAAALKQTPPGLYIVDSLDALSSDSEIDRDIREGTYGTGKAKVLSELFRALSRRLKRARICLIIISQIRDRIGAMIRGQKYSRAGGKALDFYASVIIYLSHLGNKTRTISGVKRVTAAEVKAKCTKNKIVMPFRECRFIIRFGYGVDDEEASLEWLEEVKKLKAAGFAKVPDNLDDVDAPKLREDVQRIWAEIEKGFVPTKGKYAA